MVPGTTKIDGVGGDDIISTVTLPFAYTLYDTSYSAAQAGSNGALFFGTANATYQVTCIPNALGTYLIAPFWTDQNTTTSGCATCGIFTSTSGSAPNRIFNIEWRNVYYGQTGAATLDYEVRLYEGQTRFDVIYGTITALGAANDSQLTVGEEQSPTVYTTLGCDTTGGTAPPVSSGQLYVHTLACVAPTATATTTLTPAGTFTVTATASATPVCPPAAWSTQGAYPIPIADQTSAVLGGLLYSFGGVSNSVVIANAYKYDPAANTWTAIAALPIALESASAVSDGTYLYIVGGANTAGTVQNTLYRYDPVANTYTTMAAAPTATFAQTAAYLSGKIYKISGCTTPCTAATAATEIYTISSNSWAAGGNYPTPGGFLMAVAAGGFIYAGGGTLNSTYSAKTYRYDPTAGTWDDASVTDLPIAPWGAATGVLNGRWLIGPGASSGSIGNYLYALDLSSPAGAWLALANAPTGTYRESGGVINSDFFAVGGTPFTGITTNQRYREVLCVTPSVTATPAASTPTNTPVASTSTATTPPTAARTNTATNTAVPPTNTATSTAVPATATATACALNYNYTLTTGAFVPGTTRLRWHGLR